MLFVTSEEEIEINKIWSCLYFYATWMPFHNKMMIMLDKMEKAYPIKFIAIDSDFFKTLCQKYDITSIPTILLLNNKKEIARLTGVPMTSAMKSFFAKNKGE